MEECFVCHKKAPESNLVWYTFHSEETWLCKRHSAEWNKKHKILEKKHGDCAGNTQLCRLFELDYFKWCKKNV